MPGPQPNQFAKNLPVKDGIIPSLGWVESLSDKNTDYYEPEGGLKPSTQKNFKKLLKEKFGFDFEADFRGAYSRIIVSTNSTKFALEKYYHDMEEYEIMPESKETYKLRQDAAEAMENALFYEMAKGGLAIIPPGEKEPRQIRCDVTPDTFVVTQPFSECKINVIEQKYRVTEPVLQPVPPEPMSVVKPKEFTAPEPLWPDKPADISVPPAGREPVPPVFKSRPQPPQPPAEFKQIEDKQAYIDELFKKKLAESGLKEPTAQAEDPGKFNMEEPDEVKEPHIVVPEPPVRPEACDIEDALFEETTKAQPLLDPKYRRILDNPGPFLEKEPVRPVLMRPVEVPDPVYLKLSDPPKLKYKYVLEEPEQPIIQVSSVKLPEKPVLDLSGLDEPEYPEDPGNEPPNPGFIARMFRWASSNIRDRIAAHDKWLNDRATLSERRSQWEHDNFEYEQKVNARRDKYEKDLAKYNAAAEEYKKDQEVYDKTNNFNMMRYISQYEKYQEALNELGGPAYVTAKAMLRESRELGNDISTDPKVIAAHKKIKDEYETQLEMAKAKLLTEKLREEEAYKKELNKWSKDNADIIAENAQRKAQFDHDLEEYYKELELWEENFHDCIDDPEMMEGRKQALEAEYQEKLERYFELKEEHKKAVERYEESVKMCREDAQKKGIDPEEAIEANRQIRIEEQLYDAKIDQYHAFQKAHPEIAKYNSDMTDYEEKVQEKDWKETAYAEYLEEKAEYDAAKLEYDHKKAAFDDLENAKKQYKADVDKLRKSVENEVETLMVNGEAKHTKEVEEYNAKLEQFKKDDAYWVEQKKIFDDNVRKMYEPGGVHTKWEQRKKAYEADQERFKKEMRRYENEKLTYKDRHAAWEKEKQISDAKMKDYEIKKAIYDSQMEQIKSIQKANESARREAFSKDMQDPLYNEYKMNTGRYVGTSWYDLDKHYKVQRRQDADLSTELNDAKTRSKTYQKLKKAAPEKVSKAEEASYKARLREREHVNKYPSVMRGFVKNLYQAEVKTLREADNVKDLNKENFRQAALKSMYLAVVRNKTNKFSTTTAGLLGHTKPLDDLLNKDTMNFSISQMQNNKALMSGIDKMYKSCGNKDERLDSLRDGRQMLTVYNNAYAPTSKNPTVFDPVLHEKHEYKPPQKVGPVA